MWGCEPISTMAWRARTNSNRALASRTTIKPTNTVLRVSYARTLETPFNENLVLSSEGCSDPVIYGIMSQACGPCESRAAGPGWRNEFHADSSRRSDGISPSTPNISGSTRIAPSISACWATRRSPFPSSGLARRFPATPFAPACPKCHGFSAYVVLSSVAARFFTPQVAGIGATPGGSTVFRIDHDEKFNQTTHLQYQLGKAGPW